MPLPRGSSSIGIAMTLFMCTIRSSLLNKPLVVVPRNYLGKRGVEHDARAASKMNVRNHGWSVEQHLRSCEDALHLGSLLHGGLWRHRRIPHTCGFSGRTVGSTTRRLASFSSFFPRRQWTTDNVAITSTANHRCRWVSPSFGWRWSRAVGNKPSDAQLSCSTLATGAGSSWCRALRQTLRRSSCG